MAKLKKTAGGSHTLHHQNTPITFDLFYSRRKTLSIRIYPEGRIQVDAPIGTPYPAIESFVSRRSQWVIKHLSALQATPPRVRILTRQYVSGEIYRYLGREYRLNVIEASHERITLSRGRPIGTLTVCVRDVSDHKRVQALLIRWYRMRAKHVFATRLAVCYPKVIPLGIRQPLLGIRLMKTRWGSCSSKGKITLNLKLIQSPRLLIDYVLLHELCHLKEFNHSPRFWGLLNQVLPDWKPLRKMLNHYEFGPF